MAITAPDPQPDGRQDRQQEARQGRMAATVAALQADLARSDTKASLLLGLAGAALLALASIASNLSPTVPAIVVGSLGAAALLAATLILLFAVRPDLGGDGWTNWPKLTADELRDQLASGYQADHLRFMATLAARKFRLIRAAVDCMAAGLGLLAVAAVLVATA